MCNQKMRAYVTDNGVTCFPLPYVVDGSGNFVSYPVTNRGAIPVSQAQAIGCPVYPRQSLTPGMGLNPSPLGTITEFETQNGEELLARREGQEGAVTFEKTYTISMQNLTAAAVVALLGDANKVYELAKSIPALPAPGVAGFNVSGTFGAQAINQFKLITGNNPLRIAGMRLQVGAQPVFQTGTVMSFRGQFDGSYTEQDLAIATWQNPSDFQPLLAEKKDHRNIVDGFQGYAVTVPAAATMTVTFGVSAVATQYGMRKATNA